MTRARRRLVFSATEPLRGVAPSWWQRLAPVACPWVPPLPLPLPVRDLGAAPSPEPVIVQVFPDWRGRPAIAPTAPIGETDDARAAAIGKAVHRTLEWAADAGAGDLTVLATAAAREFAAPATLVESTARTILGHAGGARFFDPARLVWSGNEVPVAHDGALLRIDRLVRLDDGVWWVLDYKLRQAPEALEPYRQQLLRYRDAVRALQPGEAVRCAFITGNGKVVEIDSA